MLIGQQQKLSESLQEYVQTFLDLLLKSSGFLLHQAKVLVHILLEICIIKNYNIMFWAETPHQSTM